MGNTDRLSFETGSLLPGLYLVEMKAADFTGKQKLIIE
jgi:hypothetical protein